MKLGNHKKMVINFIRHFMINSSFAGHEYKAYFHGKDFEMLSSIGMDAAWVPGEVEHAVKVSVHRG